MGEVIQFPAPNEVKQGQYTVKDCTNVDDICRTNTVTAARNIARILANDWADTVFTVEDADGQEVFVVRNDFEDE